LFLVTLLARSTQSPWVRAVLCWALNPKPRTTPQPADRSHSHRHDNLVDAEIWLRIVAHLLEWRPLGPQKSTGPRVRAVNCIAAAHVDQPYRLCVGYLKDPTGCAECLFHDMPVRYVSGRTNRTHGRSLVSQIIEEDRLDPLPSDWAVGPETHEFCKQSPMVFAQSLGWLSLFLEHSPLML
jgi:hypothetical protein